MEDNEIFSRVVLAGPEPGLAGGIAAVLSAYRRHISGIHILATNSRHGTVAGAFALLGAMMRIPLLRLRGVRLLHAHGASGKSFVRKCMLMSWARLWGMKTVFHCHAGPFKDYVARAGADYVSAKLRRCDAVAVLSKVHVPLFENTLGLDKVLVINNMIEPSGYKRQYVRREKVVFLFLGLLIGRKGIFELLDAAAILKERYGERFSIIVGGTGPDGQRFENQIEERGLADVVDCRGLLSGDAKESALRDADIVVLPSHAEGTPISILEGFDRGMPAVATRAGGIPDLVTDGVDGSLVPVGDADALAGAMARYIEDPALIEEHGKAAAITVRDYYPDAVSARLKEIYSGLICPSKNG